MFIISHYLGRRRRKMSADRKRPRNTSGRITSIGVERGRRDSRGVIQTDQRAREHNGNPIKTTGSTL